MQNKEWFDIKYPNPICIGTGLVSLDVVIPQDSQQSPHLWAGGSCGNVLAILAYLGWDTYPLARFSNEAATQELLADLEKWKVNTSLISRDINGSTPIIVERIYTDRNGIRQHRYEWNCPICNSPLPKYRPILARDCEELAKQLPTSQVFFFDRVARSSILLAQENRERGALIVFEPSGIKDEKLFIECLQVADIVKYSVDRIESVEEVTCKTNIRLEIQTQGAAGLRYKFKSTTENGSTWKEIPAFKVEELKDAAGSGDWCTAGIIHLLGKFGRASFEVTTVEDAENAIKFGQALATLNCQFEGARGGMYSLSRHKFEESISRILSTFQSPTPFIEKQESETIHNIFSRICPEC